MKAIRTTFFASAFVAAIALTGAAQTQPNPRPSPAPGVVSGAPGKFAIIDTDAFAHPRDGIKRLVAALQVAEREFKPRRDEITGLRNRYDSLVKEINATRAVASPASIRTKVDQAETLKTQIERKQQDGQSALDKRIKELTVPVYQDIGKALQTFARARGLSVVFDVSKMPGVVMVIDGGIDITNPFIAEYNQRNPATTTPTAPGARPQ